MLIPCPSCGQNNPQNAKQCLHCNHAMQTPDPGGFQPHRVGAPGGEDNSTVTNKLVYQIGSIIFFAILAAGFIFLMKNGRQQICVDRHDDQRIAELKSQGYTCRREVFESLQNKNIRERRAKQGVKDKYNRRKYEVCCTEPK